MTSRWQMWMVGLALSMGAAAPVAWAQATGGGGMATDGCKADMRRLCSGERPGGGRVVACLQQHEADLSPACKATLPRFVQCSAQVQQLCGEGRPRELRACVQQHRSELAGCGGGA